MLVPIRPLISQGFGAPANHRHPFGKVEPEVAREARFDAFEQFTERLPRFGSQVVEPNQFEVLGRHLLYPLWARRRPSLWLRWVAARVPVRVAVV